MAKFSIILFSLIFFNFEQKKSNNDAVLVVEASKQITDTKVALKFINDYVRFCNDRNSQLSCVEWIFKQSTVTNELKKAHKKIIYEAEKDDPELGLGFDPIFDAQDYPDDGFELESIDRISGYVTVKGINWASFKLKLRLKQEKGTFLIDGVGVINIPKEERIER